MARCMSATCDCSGCGFVKQPRSVVLYYVAPPPWPSCIFGVPRGPTLCAFIASTMLVDSLPNHGEGRKREGGREGEGGVSQLVIA